MYLLKPQKFLQQIHSELVFSCLTEPFKICRHIYLSMKGTEGDS